MGKHCDHIGAAALVPVAVDGQPVAQVLGFLACTYITEGCLVVRVLFRISQFVQGSGFGFIAKLYTLNKFRRLCTLHART